jgi:phage terminase large subunit-like protein
MLVLFLAYEGTMPNFGKVSFGGYIGNSVRGGVRQNMQTIARVYKDSDYLQDKFETVHFTDTAVKFLRHPKRTNKGVVTKQEAKESSRIFVMEGYGALAGPRGSRDGLVRPHFFIIDDVIKNAADARSDVILGNVRQMIEEDIGYALSTSRSFCIYIGTPFNLRDPLMGALVDGTWTPVVFPIAERISLDIKKEDFHGSWEDRHSYEKVMIKYRTAVHKGTLAAFMQEMMLRVAGEEDRVIRDDMINWFDRSTVIPNGKSYNWYITTDFTTTGSRSSDYSAMGVWAVNNNGDYMLVDLVVQKLELADQYGKLLELVRKYKPMTGYINVGIETSAQQKAHIFALKELMTKHNTYFTIAVQKGKNTEGVMRTSADGNKFEYFMRIVPLFQGNKIWFANELRNTADMLELLTELAYITHLGFGAKNDDALDIISQLNELHIIIPMDAPKELTYNKYTDIWEAEVIEDSQSSIIF